MPKDQSRILLTKLNRPAVTADHIYRPRLIDILNRGLSGQLNVVSAAAGFGKTTLVSAWIEELNAQVGWQVCTAWLSLDETDSDLIVFLQYVVAAIRSAIPESCAETHVLLQASQPMALAALVAALSNDIERLPQRCVLVLDDYQAIQGTMVHDFLGRLILHWPQHLHLTVISRVAPPLPIVDLRAKGHVVEIRARDLRFTLAETAAFLTGALATPLDQSALALLDQRIEGWAAGLRLATLSLHSAADAETELANLSASTAEFTDYLLEQVVSRQPPEIRKFLLVTSILDRFCPALCEYVISADARGNSLCDVSACIQWLDRANLFVVPLGNDRQWYRYHHLFQELLQHKLLDETDREQVATYHRAAAAWYVSQGLIEDALHHALTIADLELAAQLMQAGLRAVLDREDRPTLSRWLRLLPDDFIQHRPWLLMIQALVHQFSWHLPAAWKVLTQIEAMIDTGGEATLYGDNDVGMRELRGLIAALRSQEAFSCNQADRAIAFSNEAFMLLPETWKYARGGALMFWGMSMRATGQGETVHRMLKDEHEQMLGRIDAYTLRILFVVSINAIEAGNFERANQAAQTMLEQATQVRLVILQGWAHYFLGVVHYYWNELDAAAYHFEQVADRRYVVHVSAARNSLIGLVHVHLAREELPKVWEYLELLRQIDLEHSGNERDDAHSLRAYAEYLHGDKAKALRWASAYTAPVPDRLQNWLQDPHLTKARILLAEGTRSRVLAALDLLEQLYAIAKCNHCIRCQVEVQALRALALDAQAASSEAFDALSEAVGLAARGDFTRVFVDLGPPMENLLSRLVQRGHDPEEVYHFLAAFAARSHSLAAQSAFTDRVANMKLVEPLTSRELDVLALLSGRMSNKEIARQLNISLATVKRHTNSIYGKLDVDSRWGAVLKAEAIGILPKH